MKTTQNAAGQPEGVGDAHAARHLGRPMTTVQGFGLLLIAVLAGCMSRTGDSTDHPAQDPVVYRDRLTGCEYLSTGQFHSLTPRLRADGTHVCTTRPKEVP